MSVRLDTFVWRQGRRAARKHDDLDPDALRETLTTQAWALQGVDELPAACLARIEALEATVARLEAENRELRGEGESPVELRVVGGVG